MAAWAQPRPIRPRARSPGSSGRCAATAASHENSPTATTYMALGIGWVTSKKPSGRPRMRRSLAGDAMGSDIRGAPAKPRHAALLQLARGLPVDVLVRIEHDVQTETRDDAGAARLAGDGPHARHRGGRGGDGAGSHEPARLAAGQPARMPVDPVADHRRSGRLRLARRQT